MRIYSAEIYLVIQKSALALDVGKLAPKFLPKSPISLEEREHPHLQQAASQHLFLSKGAQGSNPPNTI